MNDENRRVIQYSGAEGSFPVPLAAYAFFTVIILIGVGGVSATTLNHADGGVPLAIAFGFGEFAFACLLIFAAAYLIPLLRQSGIIPSPSTEIVFLTDTLAFDAGPGAVEYPYERIKCVRLGMYQGKACTAAISFRTKEDGKQGMDKFFSIDPTCREFPEIIETLLVVMGSDSSLVAYRLLFNPRSPGRFCLLLLPLVTALIGANVAISLLLPQHEIVQFVQMFVLPAILASCAIILPLSEQSTPVSDVKLEQFLAESTRG